MKRLLPGLVLFVILAGCSSPPAPTEPAAPVKPQAAATPEHTLRKPEPPPPQTLPPDPIPTPEPAPKTKPEPKPQPKPEPRPDPEPPPMRPAKGQPLRPSAPALPDPEGATVTVDSAAKLADAVARARPGTTIFLADGRYAISRPLHIRTDGVSLRGKSGDRAKVILDGGGTLGEAIWLSTCSGVTIANLTIRDVQFNGIKLNSDTGVQRLRIYNCEFRNIWQRGVKAVAVPPAKREQLSPRDCRIEYCLFENDRPKKFGDDPTDTANSYGGDYIAGIDLMYATGWVIRENVFRGINGRTAQGRGAIFVWVDSRDCVIERNVIVDCDAGISLGNSLHDAKSPPHCTSCIVRNNCITRAPEGGITSLYTKDCKILHNTICDTTGKIERGVRVQLDADGLLVANNLLAGPKVLINTKSKVESQDNREGIAPGVFVDAATGDLHLAEKVKGVADAGSIIPGIRRDLDGRRRGERPDLGAHEFSPD